MSGNTRWVLAFDSTCGTCRRVAATVADAAGERLEILPLHHPDVLAWRRQALGEDPPSVPTLVRVDDDDVRAWTGVGLGIVLMRTLGARSTLAVLEALGELSHRPDSLPRKGFLKLAAGLTVAGGIVLSGRTPALARPLQQKPNDVEAWLDRNREQLPTTYAAVVEKPLAYRRAIYDASPPEVRGRLWLAHFDAFEAGQRLTSAQREVIDQAKHIVRNGPIEKDALGPLATAAIAAFGKEQARALLAQLGTDDTAKAEEEVLDCDCALGDPNWCGPTCHACCYQQLGCGCSWCCCFLRDSGCGSLWEYACDGWCY